LRIGVASFRVATRDQALVFIKSKSAYIAACCQPAAIENSHAFRAVPVVDARSFAKGSNAF